MSLKEAISVILLPFPSRKHVTFLFEKFHSMAIAYLYAKKRSGALAMHLIQLTVEDFALDCIAELFERDEMNKFKRLIAYYVQYNIREMDEFYLEGISRRLVFSEVSNRIFRALGEADPNLRKLIRNLKDLEPSSRAEVTEIGDKWLVCFDKQIVSSPSLPLMPPELLEAHIAPLLASDQPLRSLVDCLAKEFIEQSLYRKIYPLVPFAQSLLSAYSRLDKTASSELPDLQSLEKEDLRRLIADSVRVIKGAKYQTYVGRKKIQESTYATYFDVIAEYLENVYIHANGNAESLSMLLGKKIGRLTTNSYQGNHRVFLEFLLKETRSVFVEKLRKEV